MHPSRLIIRSLILCFICIQPAFFSFASSLEDLSILNNTNQKFSVAFFQQLSQSQEGNFFISPYGVSISLMMLYLNTACNYDGEFEFGSFLNFSDKKDNIPTTVKEGLNRYEGSSQNDHQTSDYQTSDHQTTQVPSAVSCNNPLGTLSHTQRKIWERFNRDLEGGFTYYTNIWLPRGVNGKINSLMGQEQEAFHFLLQSGALMKGYWSEAFDPAQTDQNGIFTSETGLPLVSPMMERKSKFRMVEGISEDSGDAINIPFGNYEQLVMTVILPRLGINLSQLSARLNEENLKQVFRAVDTATKSDVHLKLPKFSLSSDLFLDDLLKAMGLKASWKYTPDFDKFINPTTLLPNVFHKTLLEITEEGGKDATYFSRVHERGEEPSYKSFFINRPFIFFIRETDGNIKFMGRVLHPESLSVKKVKHANEWLSSFPELSRLTPEQSHDDFIVDTHPQVNSESMATRNIMTSTTNAPDATIRPDVTTRSKPPEMLKIARVVTSGEPLLTASIPLVFLAFALQRMYLN